MLRVGLVAYLNSLPFAEAFRCGEVETEADLVFHHPGALNEALLNGELDASFMSFAAFLKHQDRLQALGGPCIAAPGPALSVNLYLRGHPAELNGEEIAVTHQSASTRALLEVLCRHFWKVRPGFRTEEDPTSVNGPYLLIGDDALRHRPESGVQCIDLALAWYYATGLPFTFAVFVARREVAALQPLALQAFRHKLRESLNWARNHRDKIVNRAVSLSGLPQARLEAYFQCLQYEESDLSHRGKEFFAQMWQPQAVFGGIG